MATTTLTQKQTRITDEVQTEYHSEDRMDIGYKRSVSQISDTITFELKKNRGKLLAMLATSVGIYLLFLIIEIVQVSNGNPEAETAIAYFSSYLSMVDFLILIIAAIMGGSIIAEDFEKDTGNIMFPKISKGRLFTGRVIARYLLSAISITSYYVIVGITTWIKYESLPVEIWGSWGWALLYTFTILSLITFYSSFMKRSSTAIIMGILSVLMVFQLLTLILMYTGVTIEPFFMITYYSNIISAWLSMPTERFTEMTFGGPGSGATDGSTYMSWSTPSASGALIGMAIYSAVLLMSAYIVYRRRN